MVHDEPAAARAPGRPRDPAVDTAILRVTLEHVARHGIAGLSIEAVAAEAGVGKSTVYRRWPHKAALVIDAIASLEDPLPPRDDTRSARDELVALIDALRRRHDPTGGEGLMQRVIAETKSSPEAADEYFRRIVDPRRERLRAALRRGIGTAEIRADLDVELTLLLLAGPMLAQTMMPGRFDVPVDDRLAERIVDVVLEGIGIRPASPRGA